MSTAQVREVTLLRKTPTHLLQDPVTKNVVAEVRWPAMAGKSKLVELRLVPYEHQPQGED